MSHTYALSDHPSLRTVAFQLYANSRRLYRTRLKELAPPACAVVVPAWFLPGAKADPGSAQALLVRLSQDWEPYLQELAALAPEVILQPDIGMDAQAAYLSWSLSRPEFPLPRALWLEVARVMELSDHNRSIGGSAEVPLVFQAGQAFALAKFSAEPDLLRRCKDALDAEAKQPDIGKADLAKARQVAKNYGERPWLFMRYDVRIGARRIAVNWAAVPDCLPACVL